MSFSTLDVTFEWTHKAEAVPLPPRCPDVSKNMTNTWYEGLAIEQNTYILYTHPQIAYETIRF